MSIDLDAIKARAAAATEGPWYVDQGGESDYPFWQIGSVLRDRYGDNSISSHDRPTIVFIAAARDDVPALVAEVERLASENANLRAAIAEHDKVRADLMREREAAHAAEWQQASAKIKSLEAEAPTVVPELVARIQWAVRQADHALTDTRITQAAAAWLRTIRSGLVNASGDVPDDVALSSPVSLSEPSGGSR